MSMFTVDPVHWTTRNILEHGPKVILELAKKSSTITHAYRLVVGRCLLAIRESRLYAEHGYSSEIHYAISALGLSHKEACEYRRVAGALEWLPKLTRAAELGQIPWGRLREIVRKATVETEEFWLRIAAIKTDSEIQELVTACEPGKLPWEEGEHPKPVRPRRCVLQVEADKEVLFDQITQSLSQQIGRPLSMVEAFEQLAAQQLANGSLGSVKNVNTEIARSVQARRRRQNMLLKDAYQLAREWGMETEEIRGEAPAEAPEPQPSRFSDSVVIAGHKSTKPAADQAAGVERTGAVDQPPGAIPTCRPRQVGDAVPEMHVSRDEDSAHPSGPAEEMASRPRVTTSTPTIHPQSANSVKPESQATETAEPGEPGRVGKVRPERQAIETAEPDEPGRVDDPARSNHGNRAADSGEKRNAHPQTQSETQSKTRSAPHCDSSSAVKPPCSDSDFELVTIDSDRFRELLAANYIDEKLDWENRRLLFNRRARRATAAQRREVLRRDGYCCRTPGCPHRMWLELHHTVYFSRCGDTVRANLVTLCSRCHRNVHRGFLKITGDADGVLTFTDAKGRNLEQLHTTELAGWLNFYIGWFGREQDRHLPTILDAA
jgi:5-methylcytosine-specific restriction endonuclease McrA